MYNLTGISAGRSRKHHGFELPIHAFGQSVGSLCGRMTYVASPGVDFLHEKEQPRGGRVCKDCLRTYRNRKPQGGQLLGDVDGA